MYILYCSWEPVQGIYNYQPSVALNTCIHTCSHSRAHTHQIPLLLRSNSTLLDINPISCNSDVISFGPDKCFRNTSPLITNLTGSWTVWNNNINMLWQNQRRKKSFSPRSRVCPLILYIERLGNPNTTLSCLSHFKSSVRSEVWSSSSGVNEAAGAFVAEVTCPLAQWMSRVSVPPRQHTSVRTAYCTTLGSDPWIRKKRHRTDTEDQQSIPLGNSLSSTTCSQNTSNEK